VSRAEVRFSERPAGRYLATVPADACEPREGRHPYHSTWDQNAQNWAPLVRMEYHPIAELFEPLMAQLRAEYQQWRDDYLRRADDQLKLGWVRELVAKAPAPGLPSWFLEPPSTCRHCGTKFLGVTGNGFHGGEYCSDRCIDQGSPAQARAKQLKCQRATPRGNGEADLPAVRRSAQGHARQREQPGSALKQPADEQGEHVREDREARAGA
jgi:hypothetical protein